MKATIGLELFGDNVRKMYSFYSNMLDEVAFGLGRHMTAGCFSNSSWVAEITGFSDKYKYEREFLSYKKDYSMANSKGSRGIYVWYILESGKYYDIKSQYSHRSHNRYFAKVSSCGDIVKVEEEEVVSWLRNR